MKVYGLVFPHSIINNKSIYQIINKIVKTSFINIIDYYTFILICKSAGEQSRFEILQNWQQIKRYFKYYLLSCYVYASSL